MSEERRKPIPSGRKGIIEIYANFLPRFFNLQRSKPAVNAIQASVRKQAEATVSQNQNQWNAPGSSENDGVMLAMKML